MAAHPALPDFAVCAELLRSRAQPLRGTAVGPDGVWLVQWRNADTEAVYQRPQHHTLSLYLAGGEEVRCLSAPGARGGAGSLVCMPAGHESRWQVRGSLQLLHLYLPRLPLAESAERWFDLDPRAANLQDRIYFDDPLLSGLGRRLVALDWQHTDAPLQLQLLALQMQARLISAHCGPLRPLPVVKGGLAPAARRRVLERIEASFAPLGEDPTPSLRELADIACLSEYHFARMFKASFGMSPHAWVMQRRLAMARRLLVQQRGTLEQVAQQAGYAHLSHLNAALRRAGLGSATRYRRASAAASQEPVAASCGA
ncbi:MAG: helix-turn-helix transcriptional regulator [Pseudomonadota bacterium]